jgi:hypothetical protein
MLPLASSFERVTRLGLLSVTCRSCLFRSSPNLSNGETESVKTMIVHDDVESEPAMTPSKEGTLIVRQVPEPPLLLSEAELLYGH